MTIARTAWFREAKFGLFIHWGLYALPAGVWKGRTVPSVGEWLMRTARVPVDEYAALAADFNPVAFDADEWAQLAVDAGMQYVTITSKHHDGFALYRSRVSAYNSVDATPFKRDVIAELAAACARRGLPFGCYYSQSQDWHHPGGAVWNDEVWDEAQRGDFDTYLATVALPQVRELLTGYGPLALIWFDTPVNMNDQRARPFAEAIRALQPDCLINSRLLLRGVDIKHLTAEQLATAAAAGCDYISRGDNEIPPAAVPGLWETPGTLNDTWGYRVDDERWKSPAEIVFKLVDIASKGGNYLLNVGPDATGTIPLASQRILREVGAWLKVNGEALYGCGPTPYGDEFEGTAWRWTTRPGRLYLHLFEWPSAGQLALDGVTAPVTRARLLGEPARPIGVTQREGRLVLTLAGGAVGESGSVVALELA